PAPMRTGTLLEEISAQAEDALETLRDLARGIFPAVLADRGLAPALRAQLTKSSADIRLEVDAILARARFDPPVEAAIYFCCLEALQNAAKHAPHPQADALAAAHAVASRSEPNSDLLR